MTFTEKGLAFAASLEFAEQLGELVAHHDEKTSGIDGALFVAMNIAWIATGHDFNKAPNPGEFAELKSFAYQNAEKINALSRTALENFDVLDASRGPVA